VTGEVQRVVLDWSSRGIPARVGALAPCQHCGRKALLRHPDNGRPCHKVCEELHLGRVASAHGRPQGVDGEAA
jgi:hypothetical protein